MIELKRIHSEDQKEFKSVWEVYNRSFPSYELRTLNAQKACFKENNYSLFAIDCAGEVIGLLSEWEFSDFIFVENFAIKNSARDKGVGTKIIKEYFNSKNKVLISEVERPKTESDARKMSFLKSIGANLNRFSYTHTVHPKGKKEVQLFFVSYPRKISQEEYERMHKEVYAQVTRLK